MTRMDQWRMFDLGNSGESTDSKTFLRFPFDLVKSFNPLQVDKVRWSNLTPLHTNIKICPSGKKIGLTSFRDSYLDSLF